MQNDRKKFKKLLKKVLHLGALGQEMKITKRVKDKKMHKRIKNIRKNEEIMSHYNLINTAQEQQI